MGAAPFHALVLALVPAPVLVAPTAAQGPTDGLAWSSPGGGTEVQLGGLVQVLGRTDGGDRLQLKRLRPEISGHLARGAVRFNLEPKFTDHDVSLEEAWAGTAVLDGAALLMAGRMKAPFGLEEVRSRTHIDFPRFSALNQFSPAEGHGLFLNGRHGAWEWGCSASANGGLLGLDASRDLAARIMWHSPAGAWQLGAAATWGDADDPLGDTSIENAAGLAVIDFAAGAILDGRRTRAGLEAAWLSGPWMGQAEVIALGLPLASAGSSDSVGIRGAYVTLSRTLTGEEKTFRGITPSAPFAGGQGRGAWVAAARASLLELDAGLSPFTVQFRERLAGLSLGLNWIASENVTWRNTLVLADQPAPAVPADPFDRGLSLMTEWQFHF